MTDKEGGRALMASMALALGACERADPVPDPPEYGILRTQLFQACMDSAARVTPPHISDRGSWSEVINQCGDQAYYQANTCVDPKACLAALNAASKVIARPDARPSPPIPGPEGPMK